MLKFLYKEKLNASADRHTRPEAKSFRKQPEGKYPKSWEPGLGQYKEMRKKYLIYP